MNDYLNKSSDGKVKFTVKEVVFYPEHSYYICEFHVGMHSNNKDTTGTMAASISKNFSTVERTQ
jgi:hypothetical protein